MSNIFEDLFDLARRQPPPTGWKKFKLKVKSALFVALLVGPWLFGVISFIFFASMTVAWLLRM